MVENPLMALLTSLWESFLQNSPNMVLSIIIIIVGVLFGKFAGKLIRKIIKRAGVDKFVAQEDYLPIKISELAGTLTSIILYMVFLQQAAWTLGIAAINEFVGGILTFVYGAVGASVTIIVGYSLATYLKDKVINSKTIYSDMLGKILFLLILYLSIAIALPLIGVDATLINNLLLIVVASVGLGFAIAIGLGMKETFNAIGKTYVNKLKRGMKR
jgi:hypothetical protein